MSQDQTLFVWRETATGPRTVVMDGPGGGIMYTLNSTEVHGVCYGLDLQGGKGNASYTIDVAPTILSDSHGTPNAVCYENHSQDSRYNPLGETCETISAKYGTGGE